MSDHDHDNQSGGGPDTQFLDFELEKVMFDEAESIVQEAFRELLKKAAKKRIKEHWGDRIKALATLAVDEALANADASFAVQEVIEARNEARRTVEDRIRSIIRGDQDDDDDDGDDGGDDDDGDGGGGGGDGDGAANDSGESD